MRDEGRVIKTTTRTAIKPMTRTGRKESKIRRQLGRKTLDQAEQARLEKQYVEGYRRYPEGTEEAEVVEAMLPEVLREYPW